jgi:transposase
LRWGTPKENSADQKAHGTVNRGQRNGSSVLTEEQARWIKSNTGTNAAQIAASFGVSITTVKDIQRGKRWAWLEPKEKYNAS